jgi:hypothetical protein
MIGVNFKIRDLKNAKRPLKHFIGCFFSLNRGNLMTPDWFNVEISIGSNVFWTSVILFDIGKGLLWCVLITVKIGEQMEFTGQRRRSFAMDPLAGLWHQR